MWLAQAAIATLVHGVMAVGLYHGAWDAAVCIVGILLDILAVYALWLTMYLRGPWECDGRFLAKSFIGLSLGVWGFVAMFRSIALHDVAIWGTSFGFLRYLERLDLAPDLVVNDVPEEMLLVVLVIAAIALALVALYFLAGILWSMPGGEVLSMIAVVAALRAVEYLKHRNGSPADRLSLAERNLSELCLHAFVKGWLGALLMLILIESTLPLAWVYLAWSYAHDVFLRQSLWSKVSPSIEGVAPVSARSS
jgi:hypothetical protein